MKLTSLRVHGFKSFADATEVHFHDGITAIVGPNGCGKSNISDAIRWVLGEQRPTMIRGAKMEEAIFQGSVHRRPVNRGSVTMVVSNEDGTLPVPFEEVEIGRVVFRDGGSDYSVNRSNVRLKDVVDLTRDTGLGANAYNVIENRMIDAILSDRADERRALFEEAAGIGKYKDRRKAASRRLERAETDLQRLDDVIAEVQTKVRSLARQKGKAERYLEYRERRLRVEVAVVRHQLETLTSRLEEVERELEGDTREGEGIVAELQTAEARVEALRIRQVEAEKARSAAAGRLDEIRTELGAWERDLAVADERAGYARRRLAQIEEERRVERERVAELEIEAKGLREEEADLGRRLDEARAELQRSRERVASVRSRLQTARDALESVEAREREIARRGAQLEGDAESAEAQAAELERRHERLQRELEDAADALTDLQTQGDLFSGRMDDLEQAVEEARTAVEAARADLGDARPRLADARRAELSAADRAQSLEARLGALREMDRAGEGMEPAVRAATEAGVADVHGPLLDFLRAPMELAPVVEAYLGPLARGLVVEDITAAGRLRRWFQEEWSGGGGLVLLPLDRVPEASERGGLLSEVEPRGVGAPWVHALLGGVDLEDEETVLAGDGDAPSLSRSGTIRDPSGVLRIGNPSGATGVLERREQIRRLEEEAAAAREKARKAAAEREGIQEAIEAAEESLESCRERLREAEDRHREAHAEVAAQVDRKDRMDRHRDELARQLEGTRAARARALERARRARDERDQLLGEEKELAARRSEARHDLEAVQEEWEEVRSEESRLNVLTTRLEGEAGRVEERLGRVEGTRGASLRRVDALDEEEDGLEDDLAEAEELKQEGAAATRELFDKRDASEEDLRTKDAALEEVAEALRAAERKAREARQAERAASDHRHQLELERQELDGRIERIRERLEGEWGRTLEGLLDEVEPLPEEELEDPEALREELGELVRKLERIGPVNMLAVEEHEEESQRLDFLTEQYEDLIEARDDLRSAIREINETATSLFMETFERIRENFRRVHERLFEGGEADIWLEEEDDPLESAVEIHASPSGKKTQRIDLLSGGERALTALSLLFSIYLVKPSPFCVLDEVDAPLDENNIARFIRLLEEFKEDTQFVVITHNPRTIEAADWIYGVTMEEPGVSTVVGVRLEDALEQARGTAA